MNVPLAKRGWASFDELADLGEHFDLLLDVNGPELRDAPLAEAVTQFGKLFGAQQPVGGMHGSLSPRLVKQFRMPGYPLVLISTEILQEGEDLHTFCSTLHHYGISWTSSAMEQRVGRIDRVRSQTDRRLENMTEKPRQDELLQVFFPHLEDTIEVLQVQRVLERMNVFLRMMHEGLSTAGRESKTVDANKELLAGRRDVEAIKTLLKTAFPILDEHLVGTVRVLAVPADTGVRAEARLTALVASKMPGIDVDWAPSPPRGTLLGTVRLGERRQPFKLCLESVGENLMLRCVSPVGRLLADVSHEALVDHVARRPARVGAVVSRGEASYDLTVEDDVLLSSDASHDTARTALLLRRVVEQADVLEMDHLPGHDEALDTFRADLEKEGLDEH